MVYPVFMNEASMLLDVYYCRDQEDEQLSDHTAVIAYSNSSKARICQTSLK